MCGWEWETGCEIPVSLCSCAFSYISSAFVAMKYNDPVLDLQASHVGFDHLVLRDLEAGMLPFLIPLICVFLPLHQQFV